MTKEDHNKAKTQLEVCELEIDRLSPKQREYIESYSDQFSRTDHLSPKQLETLQNIYDQIV